MNIEKNFENTIKMLQGCEFLKLSPVTYSLV